MKKTWIIVIVVSIVVLVAVLYIFSILNQHPTQTVTQNTTSSQALSTPSSSATINVPVNLSFGESDVLNHPIINTSTGATISFISNTNNQTVNEGWIVSLDDKKLGPITGQTVALASFSPDNKYLAFRVSYNIVQQNIGYNLVIINLTSGAIVGIGTQPQGAFIESYTWNSDDTLSVVSYPVSFSIMGSQVEYYRTAPKQTWQYDPTTGSSSLISETP
jgi:hypothetical protein